MFRMCGNTVELYRYKITYTDNEQERQEYCISDEHKNEIEQLLTDRGLSFLTTAVDQTGNEWFNSLQFESYDAALKVFNAGEAAHAQSEVLKTSASSAQLRADLDYLAIMAGVNLS